SLRRRGARSGLRSGLALRGRSLLRLLTAVTEFPEAPQRQQAPATQSQTTPQPAPGATPPQGSSSSQTSAQQPGAGKSKHEKAEEQIKEEEHQRVAGIVPSFNVTYHRDAVSLTPAEKFRLQ